jgi:hypothetical protein
MNQAELKFGECPKHPGRSMLNCPACEIEENSTKETALDFLRDIGLVDENGDLTEKGECLTLLNKTTKECTR